MIFIHINELSSTIKADNLSQVIGTDATILDTAELEAIELVSGYLRNSYDVAAF